MQKNDYKELVQQAKSISIVSVMEDQGMEYIDMRNYAQGIEHDSLMIDKRTNRFYWNSRGIGGDVLDFMETFFDKSHMEALNYLTQENHERLEQVDATPKPKEPFHYYFKHNHDISNIHQYLVQERKLSSRLIQVLHEKGFIQEDIYKQAVFVWSDTGKAVGASVIGSDYDPEKYKRGRYKGIASNSEGYYGFNVTLGTPNKLYLFESPIDLLSYWTLNPQLENCMLADMEGLKEQSVYRFINQMYLSKGALPYEGIYLGIDNDSPGQRFFDGLSKLSYVDKETGQEISFKKMVAYDLDIPKENIGAYLEAGEAYSVDWRAIAATHKSLTNFSPEGKLANAWDERSFFSGEGFDLVNESHRVAERLKETETAPNEYNFQKLFLVDEGNNPRDIRGLTQKVSTYYEDYRNLGYRPTDALIKDWNDALQYKVFVQQEAKILEAVFRRNENELMMIQKEEETNKYVAKNVNEQFHTPFFEADSPEEAAMLAKNYGFQAVDKEDRRKYQVAHTPEAKKSVQSIGIEQY